MATPFRVPARDHRLRPDRPGDAHPAGAVPQLRSLYGMVTGLVLTMLLWVVMMVVLQLALG